MYSLRFTYRSDWSGNQTIYHFMWKNYRERIVRNYHRPSNFVMNFFIRRKFIRITTDWIENSNRSLLFISAVKVTFVWSLWIILFFISSSMIENYIRSFLYRVTAVLIRVITIKLVVKVKQWGEYMYRYHVLSRNLVRSRKVITRIVRILVTASFISQ